MRMSCAVAIEPVTTNAPVVVPVLPAWLVIKIWLVVVFPRPVIVCNVEVFQTVTALPLTTAAVSVPAVIVLIGVPK